MNKILILTGIAGLMTTAALAGTISYDTNASTLSCGTAVSCIQDNATEVTLGGTLDLTYNPGSGNNVTTPSIINLGNLVSSGTGSLVSAAGLVLSLHVHSTPPGSTGILPVGTISGLISTNSSSAILSFLQSDTTTIYGTLPGVDIGGIATYQVLQTSLGLEAPSVGNPHGETTIQGTVVSSSTPEPGSILLLSTGLIGFVLARKRLS